MRFELSLRDRMRISARRKHRYATEPGYRLRCVNRERAKRGLPPAESVEEILTYREAAARAVESRQRQRGRFV